MGCFVTRAIDVEAVLGNEYAARKCRAQIRRADVEAIGLGHAVNRRSIADDEGASKCIRWGTIIDVVGVGALARGNDVASAVAFIDERDPLGVCREMAARDGIDADARIAVLRLGAVGPNPDIFLRHKERAVLIVGRTPFRL